MNDNYCEDIVEINNVIMLTLTIKLNFSSSILPFFIFFYKLPKFVFNSKQRKYQYMLSEFFFFEKINQIIK